MKKNTFLRDYIHIANIHADRLHTSLIEIANITPLTSQKLSQLNTQQLAFLDMMTTRFCKLQDIIGAKYLY